MDVHINELILLGSWFVNILINDGKVSMVKYVLTSMMDNESVKSDVNIFEWINELPVSNHKIKGIWFVPMYLACYQSFDTFKLIFISGGYGALTKKGHGVINCVLYHNPKISPDEMITMIEMILNHNYKQTCGAGLSLNSSDCFRHVSSSLHGYNKNINDDYAHAIKMANLFLDYFRAVDGNLNTANAFKNGLNDSFSHDDQVCLIPWFHENGAELTVDHYAYAKSFESVKYLVNNNIDINQKLSQSIASETPLLYSIHSKDIDKVETLLKCGAKMDQESRDYYKKHYPKNIIQKIEKIEENLNNNNPCEQKENGKLLLGLYKMDDIPLTPNVFDVTNFEASKKTIQGYIR